MLGIFSIFSQREILKIARNVQWRRYIRGIQGTLHPLKIVGWRAQNVIRTPRPPKKTGKLKNYSASSNMRLERFQREDL